MVRKAEMSVYCSLKQKWIYEAEEKNEKNGPE
jgi:hypothetical protein